MRAGGAVRRWAERRVAPRVPPRLRERWRRPEAGEWARFTDVLAAHGYRPGASGLADHLHGRLEALRTDVVPWLDDACPLAGATVLEIGCGTGSSTVALAEQGAHVIGVDLLAERVQIARARCATYGVAAELHVADAAEGLDGLLGDRTVDVVIFFAVLEHMTLDERLAAVSATWRRLRPDGRWCIVDTPNRLWVRDGHTSGLPFFHWLPDDLALHYAARSARPEVASLGPGGPDAGLELIRQGRGVSFHDLEVALGPGTDLDVVSDLTGYRNRASPLRALLHRAGPGRRTERMLRRAGPPLHPAFYEEGLNLVLRRTGTTGTARG